MSDNTGIEWTDATWNPITGLRRRGPVLGDRGGCGVNGLVLSLFPGIGLLDMAFEEEGFCVVRGPDLLWGGDVKRFHPPADKFDGVIGGPPCQFASEQSRLNNHLGRPLALNLIPEFERCIAEAAPLWFLMENVHQAPLPAVPGYVVRDEILRDSWCGGETMRRRRFSFGTEDGRLLRVDTMALHRPDPFPAIVSSARAGHVTKVVNGKKRKVLNVGPRLPAEEMARRQGLPDGFVEASPFTVEALRKAMGNGVPLAMGRAVAQAVKKAIAPAKKAQAA